MHNSITEKFYFDGNQWFGVVDTTDKFFDLLKQYHTDEDLERILNAKMAPLYEIDELPESYHFGAPGVRTGEIPNFGFRREHRDGTIRLEDWAKVRGMDLRKLATRRHKT